VKVQTRNWKRKKIKKIKNKDETKIEIQPSAAAVVGKEAARVVIVVDEAAMTVVISDCCGG
jgi:phosphate starvation-inducible protein PhoH